MGGLLGAIGRMKENRQLREVAFHSSRYNRSRSLDPDRMTGVSWLVQIAIQKRRCRVHGLNDRCWRKPKEGKQDAHR